MKAETVMTKTNHQFIVGLVVVLSFIILTIFVLMVSGISTVLRPGYNLNVYYDYIRGVGKGSGVKYAGVQAGEIVDMDVVYDQTKEKPQVKVTIFLDNWVVVRESSSIYVRGSTPLSEPHLEIIDRGEKEDGKVLEHDSSIQGISPTPIEDLVANGEVIAQQLRETVTKINSIMGDEKVGEDLRNLVGNLSELAGTMNEILAKNQGKIGETIEHVEQATQDLEALVEQAKSKDSSVGRFVNDDELYEELLAFVKEIKARPWRLMKRDNERKRFLFLF
ncbi:MAG: MCE family protein [Candidatus Omnitrophica bacterium]|nr:MCE family protein [Candidatus Omnitrophota bacterium]